jgi:hypothetical protein
VIVTSEDSPAEKMQYVRDQGISLPRSVLDGHCWYPAAQRCGCGLNLRSALLWTDHIADLAAVVRATAG